MFLENYLFLPVSVDKRTKEEKSGPTRRAVYTPFACVYFAGFLNSGMFISSDMLERKCKQMYQSRQTQHVLDLLIFCLFRSIIS